MPRHNHATSILDVQEAVQTINAKSYALSTAHDLDVLMLCIGALEWLLQIHQ